jgi:LysR family transcriptional regulator for metE and metH
LAEYLESGSIVARPLGREGLRGTLHAAIRDADYDRPWMDDFIEIARNALAQGTPGNPSNPG